MESIWVIIKYAFLGLLQGLTEPIPISSSGHVVLAQHLFGLEIEGMSFEAFINFASLLAVLLIFRNDLIKLIVNSLSYLKTRDKEMKSDFMFVIYLVIATIPAAVIGLLFNDFISEQLKGVKVIGVTLLITAVALWMIRNMRGKKQEQDLTLKDAIIVGFAQAIALIPGISRSGATIVAAMSLGMKRETALRFSFFLYIPVSVGGMILEASNIAGDPNMNTLWLAYLMAFVCSLVASYFSLKWFIGVMQRGNLKIFSYYCVVAGIAVLLFM